MKIDRIYIENYRSLRKIDIYPKELCIFVGENNSGKSNILRALNLVLGETWPTARSLNKLDFFNNNMNNPIFISIDFKDNEDNIERIFFKAGLDETGTLKTDLKMNYRGNGTPYYVKKEIRERYGILYIKATRNLEYHLGQSSWTLMGKVSRLLNEKFSNISSVSIRREEIDAHYQKIKDALSIPEFKVLEQKLKDSLYSQLLRTEHDIALDFQHFDPLNQYKTLQLIPKELGEIKEIDQLGDGMKNMILLALFRAYASTFPGTSIIAIEEPEIYLHPQSRRSLYALFKELAKEGTQIFFTTHSAEFIDLEYFDEICVVKRDKDNDGLYSTTITHVDINSFLKKRQEETEYLDITSESIRQFLRNISDSETNKSFFSRLIVIVEGNTEKFALPIYAKKLDFDFNKHGIEVVAVNGKNQIGMFLSLYTSFGFPVYVIWDGDKVKQKGIEVNKKLTKRFKSIEIDWPKTEISEGYTVFENDFEDEFSKNLVNYEDLTKEVREMYGLKKDRNKQIIAKYIANRLQINDIPLFIKDIISKIKLLWEDYYGKKD